MFLDWLFGKGNNDNSNVVSITSILPDGAKQLIDNNSLPTFNTATIVLAKNETCHFIDKAIRATEKKQKVNKLFRAGNSIRIAKGWTIHLGGGSMTPRYNSVVEYHNGVIYITNKRIIFSSNYEAFDKKLSDLSAIIPYRDGLTLQFGEKIYKVFISDPIYAAKVINMLTNA